MALDFCQKLQLLNSLTGSEKEKHFGHHQSCKIISFRDWKLNDSSYFNISKLKEDMEPLRNIKR